MCKHTAIVHACISPQNRSTVNIVAMQLPFTEEEPLRVGFFDLVLLNDRGIPHTTPITLKAVSSLFEECTSYISLDICTEWAGVLMCAAYTWSCALSRIHIWIHTGRTSLREPRGSFIRLLSVVCCRCDEFSHSVAQG